MCTFSGGLGPKKAEGDGKSPEGFYAMRKSLLNPNSNYHLAFNIGYPNAYDRSKSYTGSYIMIHGKCVSIGCYAMTDNGIEEIYALVIQALSSGQTQVPIHIFPFKMNTANMKNIKALHIMLFGRS
ncbi:L,D-transpeptidase family protein [Snodgrassella alvi]|uniref:L,D-transpeptidase family protein n=1 Tax=Snodgrassella alvi TaxID=1196083 RepID=UPI0021491D56|nr:L,D-transpeptidase family protein [Snodgrassella alvi]